ncbi:YcfL family protein [Marinobacter sp. X15-166B]|uniref:YcfL family protein n=1 Tax=Marinobacter sp. X15-166B TaxID=1897620 RepID=UPI00085CD219|nr:YcfL family protein [Marinobacter sp. X15-166B]OEY65502.1 hypothetical protein BG841_02860 [Marinobacter sp. X15-166B]
MKRLFIASLLSVVAVLVGCATPPETSSSAARQQLNVDPDVSYSMTVAELFEERVAQAGGGSLLHIQFAVAAHSDAELAWKVTWFDANGMTVKGVGEAYRRATLLTGQTRYFKAVAPHSRVTDYQLHLREPN